VDLWEELPLADPTGKVQFGVRSRHDGTALILAVGPNDHGARATELETQALRHPPAGFTQGEVVRTTHQALAAIEVRGIVERADGRWRWTQRLVPTRRHVYAFAVLQPFDKLPSAAAVLLDAVRLEGSPSSPPPPEPTGREGAISHLVGEAVLGVLVLGVVAEGLRCRRLRRQAPADEP